MLSLPLALADPLTGRYVARVLAAAAVVTAGATAWTLALLDATLLGDVPPVARGRAGRGGQAAAGPVPVVIGPAACPALVVVGVRLRCAVQAGRRTGRALRRLCAGQPTDTGRIVARVGCAGHIGAAARSGPPSGGGSSRTSGSIAPTGTGVLVAAADPLLWSVRSTVSHLVERWADKRAAAVVPPPTHRRGPRSQRGGATRSARRTSPTAPSPTVPPPSKPPRTPAWDPLR
nr:MULTISPECIES: hypothetical protein [Streptomyces]